MTELDRYRQALFAAATIAAAAMLALPPLLAFRLDFPSFTPVLVLAIIPALVLPYAAWRKLTALRSVLETTSIGLLSTIPVLVFTYAAMRVNMPLADNLLAAMDRMVGFDWVAFVSLVDRSSALSFALLLAYSSFSFQLLFLPSLLGIAGHHGRAYLLVLAFLILCSISAAIGLFFPSLGAYQAFGVDPASLSHVDGYFGHAFLASFNAVRADEMFTLGLRNASGIVTFPSVHVGVAAICAWAAWPSRWLRYPFLVLNLLMTLSAITNGAHYLVDIIAGGLVALATVPLVHFLAGLFRRDRGLAAATITAAAV